MTALVRIALLLVIGLSVGYEYRTIRTATFVYEDELWNEACQSSDLSITGRLTSPRGFPRTGALLSWCWQRHQGDSVFGFHVVNLAMHLLVSCLLGVLVYQITSLEAIAWCVAGIFAVHPLGIESAGYLAGRGELMAAVGVLLACISALAGEYMAMIFSIGLGVLGKETALVAMVTVPLVLYLRSTVHALAVALAGTVLSLGVFAATIYVDLIHLSPWSRMEWALVQATAFVRLTALAVIPIGQTPTHDYSGIGLFWQGLALLTMAGLLTVAWREREREPLFSVGLAWVVLTSAPRLLVPTPPSPFNEHQFYVPLMGVLLMLAEGLQRLSVRTA